MDTAVVEMGRLTTPFILGRVCRFTTRAGLKNWAVKQSHQLLRSARESLYTAAT